MAKIEGGRPLDAHQRHPQKPDGSRAEDAARPVEPVWRFPFSQPLLQRPAGRRNLPLTDNNTTGADAISTVTLNRPAGASFTLSAGAVGSLNELCAGAAGKANFGFVSKYLPGANLPSGNTEFQFKAGGLNFKSTAYDWLVIAVYDNGTDQAIGGGSIVIHRP
ncbi:MAG: hypothetical protein ACREUU_03260 [Gammaproteobacteria bacterium]